MRLLRSLRSLKKGVNWSFRGKMNFNLKKFKQIRKGSIEFYNNLGEIKCPYFNDKVSFNSKGMQHLRFKSWNKTRSIQDQYVRFKLLKYAPEVIKKSNTLQEICQKKNFERVKINSRWEQKAIGVNYYGFVAIMDEIRIKIIIKEVVGGEKYFWSIVPCWKQDKAILNKKILHEGDLEGD